MKTPKILVAEDEALVAMLLKKHLLRAGCNVCEIAFSGEQAVQIAHQEQPDAILMDIRLLGSLDGIEAARQIREFLTVPIIFTTGFHDHCLQERAGALNPVAYLTKPIDARQINDILQSVFVTTSGNC